METKIYNEDCLKNMTETMDENSVDLVITSPPYNNSRAVHTEYCIKTSNSRYMEYDDNKTNDEYIDWICQLFQDGYDRIVKENGVVLFNMSYGSENPTVMFECISEVCRKTNWMVADVISWKKNSALPNNVSTNKCTRICEFVFVFCRKDEYKTFKANKTITSYSKTGQPFYSIIYNYIEASNNDGSNDMNKATFSTDFVLRLLEMYAPYGKDTVVYDSFMGTGTTAVACKMVGMSCYGAELSKSQCEYAERRIQMNGDIKSVENKRNEDAKFEKFDWGF